MRVLDPAAWIDRLLKMGVDTRAMKKEVGGVEVYNPHCLRSARGNHCGGRLIPGSANPSLHSLTSESATILRFVERLRRDQAVLALTTHGIPCDVTRPR